MRNSLSRTCKRCLALSLYALETLLLASKKSATQGMRTCIRYAGSIRGACRTVMQPLVQADKIRAVSNGNTLSSVNRGLAFQLTGPVVGVAEMLTISGSKIQQMQAQLGLTPT
jgi:hypothetical protein